MPFRRTLSLTVFRFFSFFFLEFHKNCYWCARGQTERNRGEGRLQNSLLSFAQLACDFSFSLSPLSSWVAPWGHLSVLSEAVAAVRLPDGVIV